MAMKGLVIRQPWIGLILHGEKTWEMRSQPCRHRGQIALIEKGSGLIVGLARIVDDLEPLSEADMRSTIGKHGIPLGDIPDAVRNRWVRPWVLADVVRLPRPVPYEHTSGGSWVNLSDAEEEAVRSAARGNTSVHPVQTRIEPTPRERRVVDDSSSVSVRRTESKVYIDVAWDDETSLRRRRSAASQWLEVIGIFAALFAMICLIGFMIHFFLGLTSSSISALSAFKWWIPLAVFAMIAGATGQGHLFDDLARNR